MSEWESWKTFLLGKDALVIQLFAVVTATLFIDYLQKRILLRLQRKAEQTTNLYDDAVLFAIQRPLSLLIWVVGISFAAEIASAETSATVFELVEPARYLGIIITLAWFGVRFVSAAEHNIRHRAEVLGRPIDPVTAEAIAKLLRAAIIITAVLTAMQTMGVSISGILAFGGIGGIAVGFAAKDLLANFFGGMIIYLDRPFKVGDWIRSPDRDIEGTVERIGWRLTCIRTFDKRPLYVPNAVFSSIAVENPSRMTNRRIYETVGIRYDDAGHMDAIIDDVRQMLENHPAIDTNQTLIVNFNKFAPSSLDFFVYTFTKTTNWVEFHAIKQDVMLKIVAIIEDHGAECAFPTSTIHLASTPKELLHAGLDDVVRQS